MHRVCLPPGGGEEVVWLRSVWRHLKMLNFPPGSIFFIYYNLKFVVLMVHTLIKSVYSVLANKTHTKQNELFGL